MAYPHERDESGVVTRKNPGADQAAGDPEEAQPVTGRANDLGSVTSEPALANSTFGARSQARNPRAKAVRSGEIEDKAMSEDKSAKRRSTK